MKTFRLILLLALVFFAGAVVGVVGARAVMRRVVQQAVAHPERIQAVIERSLTRKLRLDNSQQAKLHDILSDTHGRLKDLRREYGPQFVLIISNANGQITAILTPEQQARYEKLKEGNHPLLQALQQSR
jgi:Spy/CpxP family protein refolding chaperone